MRNAATKLTADVAALRGKLERLFELSKNLWLTDHERVQTGRDPQEVPNGIHAGMFVGKGVHAWKARELAEQFARSLRSQGHSFATGTKMRRIKGNTLRAKKKLHAVAGRQTQRLGNHAAVAQLLQQRRDLRFGH
jgi:hypothetical protein